VRKSLEKDKLRSLNGLLNLILIGIIAGLYFNYQPPTHLRYFNQMASYIGNDLKIQ